jgi:hypothetical protein
LDTNIKVSKSKYFLEASDCLYCERDRDLVYGLVLVEIRASQGMGYMRIKPGAF